MEEFGRKKVISIELAVKESSESNEETDMCRLGITILYDCAAQTNKTQLGA